ncbi:mannan endo-1,4-beta-mannosidase [Draconibacterium orientale]|uniref:Mannan endo-1,4-beta-mannosidase n=2 Tax=Draconibacterium orientale TaxID=1168034 RepID=A0A1I0JKW1_9BACT|nr:glycosyl hydrolase [Draconibacterium orientale]SEU10966.1 mannan endo-1,4-beta-mannosidase [Draconibacterium orientale]
MSRYWKLLCLTVLLFGCGKEEEEVPNDVIAPEVVQCMPEDGATAVSLETSLFITYSEEIKLGKAYNITLNNQHVEASVDGRVLTLSADMEENTDYIVNITATSILDLANNYAKAYTYSFSTKPEIIVEINPTLAVTNPSVQAVNVYNFLMDNYGNKIISSTIANVSWNTNEAKWIHQHTGKYPAMHTFDYIHLRWSPANWIDYSDTKVVEDWWNNNGIISACWHWNVPSYNGSSEYTSTASETTFNAGNALREGTWENGILKADLEKMVGYLKLLQIKNIPVVWRPLHEAAGNIYEYNGGSAWFWWGADGAESFKQLWIYMFDYFELQGLNNLIWVWTTQTKDDDFYPGDEYVDIIGRDIYDVSDASTISSQFISVQERYPTKMVTLSEFGSVAPISEQWSAGAKWSYFMPWYDYERTNNTSEPGFSSTNHEHANAAWWQNAFDQNYVITLDQMPSLK